MTYQRSVGGFNRSPSNRDKIGSTLYGRAESDSLSSGAIAADIIFFIGGPSQTASSGAIAADIIFFIGGPSQTASSGAIAADIYSFIEGISKTISSGTCATTEITFIELSASTTEYTGSLHTRLIDESNRIRREFNRSPFNAADFGSVLYGRAESDSLTKGTCVPKWIDFIHLSASTISVTDLIPERIYVTGSSGTISSTGIDINLRIYVTGSSGTISSTNIAEALYRVITMVYSGEVASGESVCIDGVKYTVTLGGNNAIQSFDGDFPRITPGINEVTYSDSESSRTVKVIVTRRDRHV